MAHCSACGGGLASFEEHGVGRARCVECSRVVYRNSKPCVGAIIRRADAVLLSQRAGPPLSGMWDLPGGFLESGEHPEEGIVRELREETGLVVRAAHLVTIGMGTYDEHDTLNLVYVVDAEGEPVAADDSAELRWFPLNALPELAFPHEAAALALVAAAQSSRSET